MSQSPRTSKTAQETAEKVLASIYGEDLIGCRADLTELTKIIQQGIDAESKDYRELAQALIGAIQQIQIITTPPPKSDIRTTEELIQLLGSRADGIQEITTKILTAWQSFQQQDKP